MKGGEIIFEKVFNKAEKKPSNLSTPERWFVDLLGGISTNGISVTPELALNLSTVFKCVLIRAGTISKMPLQTFMKCENGGKKRVNDDASYLLETRPNRVTTPSQLKKMMSLDVDLWGNSYVLITKKRKSLKRLEPWLVKVKLMSDGSLNYDYSNPITKRIETYTDDEIMHFKEISTDGILGKSKIQIARETISNNKASNKLLSKYYENGTLAKGFLTHPAALGKESKDNIKKAWKDANTGIEKAYEIPVLDAGLEYKDISMSFEDAQFLSLNKFSVEEIARFFNVPPYMVGIMDGAKFNNVQSQAMDFVTTTIQPLITDWEEEISYKYYYTTEKQKGYYCKFNMAVAMRADDLSRADFYTKMLDSGIYSLNKCLSLEEEESIGDIGDRHYRSLNYVDLEIMNEYQLNKSKRIYEKGGVKNE
ncbi:phage portal protein [Clostridium perfringens]